MIRFLKNHCIPKKEEAMMEMKPKSIVDNLKYKIRGEVKSNQCQPKDKKCYMWGTVIQQ